MKKTWMLGLLLAGTACEKQLQLSPLTNLTDVTYYRTAADALAVVNSCYAHLNSLYGLADGFTFVDLVTTDDAVPFLTGGPDRPLLWRYNITPSNVYVNLYAPSYAGINRCNTVIDRLPGIPMDEALKKRYVAEAKFVRALHYFNLVRLYGDVPLATRETTSLEGLNVARTPVGEVYAQIEADLAEAESTLPRTYPAADAGRATQGAAKALLAKVYLTRAGTTKGSPYWAQAAAKCKEVMDSGGYDLWPNFADAFSLAAKGGREAVFEVQFLTDVRGNPFGTHYGIRGVPLYPGPGSGAARVSPSLFNAYDPTDRRRAVTFQTSFTLNGVTTTLSVTDPDPTRAVSFQKLWDRTARTSGGLSFPYLRYADVLLMHAEALNEAGNGPNAEAFAALNRVRTRAGLPALAGLDYAAFREAVWRERRLEFAFENQRRFDLLRTGRLLDAVKAENSFSRNALIQPFHALLPLPLLEMDANPSLVQNPGY